MQNDFFLYPSCENNKVPSLILQTDLIVFWHWSHSDYFKVFRFAKSLVGTKNLRSVFKKEKISFHFRDSSSPVCFNPFAPFHFISNLIFFFFFDAFEHPWNFSPQCFTPGNVSSGPHSSSLSQTEAISPWPKMFSVASPDWFKFCVDFSLSTFCLLYLLHEDLYKPLYKNCFFFFF